MNRAVIVICDSLRTDLITDSDAPFLSELPERSARFANQVESVLLQRQCWRRFFHSPITHCVWAA